MKFEKIRERIEKMPERRRRTYPLDKLDSTPKNGVITRVKFTRDLVEHLGGQGQKSVSEDFYIEKIRDGVVIDRELVDVSGGRPHVVDLDAAGGYGKAIRAALQEG